MVCITLFCLPGVPTCSSSPSSVTLRAADLRREASHAHTIFTCTTPERERTKHQHQDQRQLSAIEEQARDDSILTDAPVTVIAPSSYHC